MDFLKNAFGRLGLLLDELSSTVICFIYHFLNVSFDISDFFFMRSTFLCVELWLAQRSSHLRPFNVDYHKG